MFQLACQLDLRDKYTFVISQHVYTCCLALKHIISSSISTAASQQEASGSNGV